MKVKLVSTTMINGDEKITTQSIEFEKDLIGEERYVVNLYPDVKYETFQGFGGAITDAAAYVYSHMTESQKKELMMTYFSEETMKYNIVRIHMDSCDFSVEQYQAMDDPTDLLLQSFSFERTEKYIIPMLKDANEMAKGNLKLMLSPWSPPTFMKTNESRTKGGSLKPEFRKMWANYICRYIKEFQTRGYQVERISLQNEPKAVQSWDSCIYSAQEEKEFLKDFMYPALIEHGLGEVKIFIWDHNKERVFERVRDIVDQVTDPMIDGVAFHWYSGDHFEALELVRQQYPTKKMIMSESCLEYSKFDAGSILENAEKLSHEIIGDLNHGMCAFYDWNILLDENGGPNHVGNLCHAPFLFDMQENKLIRQTTQSHFYHFSHFIIPGSIRIGYSKYTDLVDVTTYLTPENDVVVVMLNRLKEVCPINIRLQDEIVRIDLEPKSIVTCVIS